MLHFKHNRAAARPVWKDTEIHTVFLSSSCLLLPALPFFSSPCLLSSDWCQQMSEPAYGFVLFDYISGNLEGQIDKSQLL